MKMILKLFALPLLLVVKILVLMGKVLTNISSYVIGLLLLVIGGCAIYCIVTGQWKNLSILIAMGFGVFAITFVLVLSVFVVEGIGERLSEFIRA